MMMSCYREGINGRQNDDSSASPNEWQKSERSSLKRFLDLDLKILKTTLPEEPVVQPSPAKRVRRVSSEKKRIITFAESPQVLEFAETLEEKTRKWNRRSDFIKILLGVQDDIVAFSQNNQTREPSSGSSALDDIHCLRGLEKYLDNNTSRLLRQQTINAVLGHQTLQKTSRRHDPESLAMMSRCFSNLAKQKAFKAAEQDAQIWASKDCQYL